jgi:hypothetical protein
LDRAAARIEGSSPRNRKGSCDPQTIGNTIRISGYARKRRDKWSAIELHRHARGEEHPDTLGSMSSLTEILYLQASTPT